MEELLGVHHRGGVKALVCCTMVAVNQERRHHACQSTMRSAIHGHIATVQSGGRVGVITESAKVATKLAAEKRREGLGAKDEIVKARRTCTFLAAGNGRVAAGQIDRARLPGSTDAKETLKEHVLIIRCPTSHPIRVAVVRSLALGLILTLTLSLTAHSSAKVLLSSEHLSWAEIETGGDG